MDDYGVQNKCNQIAFSFETSSVPPPGPPVPAPVQMEAGLGKRRSDISPITSKHPISVGSRSTRVRR